MTHRPARAGRSRWRSTMPETLEFKAELKQLLHLITHSLYSDREIFLRELVSNAADAVNKARFDSLANADRLEGDTDWKIRLTPDKDAGTLTVSDNGVGMTRQEVIDNLGTIAPAEKPTRGTDVILHLKEDAKEFLDPWRLRALVKKFSDFIEFPVVMEVEKEKDGKAERTEETLNTRKAIWLRKKTEVAPDEYAEFYKQLAHDAEPPAATIHYAAEGKTEFKVLAFIPRHKPFSLEWEEPVAGLKLYVQRVLIMDRCEQVLPSYLRFVKGVVDSSDLP